MTSRVYSRKLYPFTSAFSVGMLLLNTAVLVLMMMGLSFSKTSLAYYRMNNPDAIYMFVRDVTYTILSFILIAQALTTALLIFGFMLNKRASAAYLSLPIGRGRLFWSRYIAGLVVICLPAFIFMTWQLYLNVQVFGYSSILLTAYGIVTAGMLIILFTVYSLTVFICLCVGTIAEGLIFTVITLMSVLLMAFALNFMMTVYLPGNTYGEYTGALVSISPQLPNYVTPYMPVLGCMSYTSNFLNGDTTSGVASAAFWGTRFDGSVTLVLWMVIALTFTFFAYKAFMLYKAERAGVIGVNKPLNFFVSFILVFFTFALVGETIGSSIITRLLYGIVVSFAIYLVCRYLLTFSIKKIFNGIWQYGVMLSVSVVTVCILATGMFGYSAWIPDATEVARATITYTGAPDFIRGDSFETGSFYAANDKTAIYIREFENLWFTSESDIQTVVMLHKKMIDSGLDLFADKKQQVTNVEKDRIKLKITVSYVLKNGKTVTRQYKSVTAQTAIDMLALDDTDLVRSRVDVSLRLTDDLNESLTLAVTDPLFVNISEIPAGDAEVLFNALRTDAAALSLEDKYYPSNPVLAVVAIKRLKDEINYASYAFSFTTEGSESVLTIEGEPVFNIFGPDSNTMRFYITEDYVNTLAWLTNGGYVNPVKPEIIEMYAERYPVNPGFHTQAPYFRSYTKRIYVPQPGSVSIDGTNFNDLISRVRNNYYAAEGGYLVYVHIKDSENQNKWVAYFLPETSAPDYLNIR